MQGLWNQNGAQLPRLEWPPVVGHWRLGNHCSSMPARPSGRLSDPIVVHDHCSLQGRWVFDQSGGPCDGDTASGFMEQNGHPRLNVVTVALVRSLFSETGGLSGARFVTIFMLFSKEFS